MHKPLVYKLQSIQYKQADGA